MYERHASFQTAAIIAGITLAGTILYLMLTKKWRRKYVRVGKVSKLLIYPVKAFAAQEVETADCSRTGIKVGGINDRTWAIVDDRGLHVDQKEVPRFVLLQAKVEDGELCISGPDMEPLKLKVLDGIPDGAKIVKCKVFRSSIEGVDCGEEAATWIQQYSGKPSLRLLQFVPDLRTRPSSMRGLCKLKGEDYPLFFQSDHTYLFLSEASVEDLNSRMNEKVTYLNFRPNILIEGCQSFDEDKWKYAKIGDTATFVQTTACDRCAITTVNPQTGVKGDKEPLATLRKFRLATLPKEFAEFKYAPLFGTNYGLDVEGKVSVGDEVYAVYK